MTHGAFGMIAKAFGPCAEGAKGDGEGGLDGPSRVTDEAFGGDSAGAGATAGGSPQDETRRRAANERAERGRIRQVWHEPHDPSEKTSVFRVGPRCTQAPEVPCPLRSVAVSRPVTALGLSHSAVFRRGLSRRHRRAFVHEIEMAHHLFGLVLPRANSSASSNGPPRLGRAKRY